MELSVIITCDDEDEYDSAVDNVMDLIQTWSGAVSGVAWESVPDDEE